MSPLTPDEWFGSIIDAEAVEGYVKATLEAWLPSTLAAVERIRALDPESLPQPKSWPVASEFDINVEEQLPAIFIVSPGTAGKPERDQNGAHRKTWRFEVAVVIGAKNERESRKLGALYLAAIIVALIQNRSLGGNVEKCINVGPDDHAFGLAERRRQRAIYGTAFEVTVKDAFNDRAGPADPPDNPYVPDPLALSPNEAVIDVNDAPGGTTP